MPDEQQAAHADLRGRPVVFSRFAVSGTAQRIHSRRLSGLDEITPNASGISLCGNAAPSEGTKVYVSAIVGFLETEPYRLYEKMLDCICELKERPAL